MRHSRENDRNRQDLPSQTGELLSDLRKNGKSRKWSDYKKKSLAVSESYRQDDELTRYADRLQDCASWLKFKSCPSGHEKRLTGANFCRCRLCPTCQWRKSLAMWHLVYTLIHAHKKQYKSDIPLLLTLTIPNVKAEELAKSLDNMQYAYRKLVNRNPFIRAVRSWFRSLEITYNLDRDDYHPHFHILLLVPEAYFKKSRGLYIDQKDWLRMWRESTGIESITQVDIRRVRKRSQKGTLESVTAEVAKYATKPSNYLKRTPEGDYTASDGVISSLHHVLKGRRLIAFGGLFSKLRKQMKLKDIEEADLVNITEQEQSCQCSVCQSTLKEEIYSWHLGLRGYVG